MQTYIDQITEIGTQVLEPYKGAKNHHDVKCLTCGYEWNCTLVSIKRNNKVYGYNGCKECTKLRRYSAAQQKYIKSINEAGFDILTEDYKGEQSTTFKIKVRNTHCGHVFESAPGNLIHNQVLCPICNNETKSSLLNASSKSRCDEYHLTATEWDSYRHKVYALTRESYSTHHLTINPFKYPRGKAGVEGAYHLDHIVPVRWCFDNNIPTRACSDYTNLQMLPWFENVSSCANLKEGIVIPPIIQEHL